MRMIVTTVALMLLSACSETPDQQFARACREMKEVGPPLYNPDGACKVGAYLSPDQKQHFAEVWFALKDKLGDSGVRNIRRDKDGNLIVP